MILCLLYHRTLGIARSVTPLGLLEAQFSYISSRYETVFPGDKPSSKLQICLTFDDGYVDFYFSIFPLLKKYKLKALLAPITSYIPDKVERNFSERLSALSKFESPIKGDFSQDLYCSWDELKEMHDSSLVKIACHSHTHPKRISSNSFDAEVVYSKRMIEDKIGCRVDSFIFPYGTLDSELFPEFQNHFSYLFRIGGALNWHWNQKNHLYYRISCDEISNHLAPFQASSLLKYSAKRCFSSIICR